MMKRLAACAALLAGSLLWPASEAAADHRHHRHRHHRSFRHHRHRDFHLSFNIGGYPYYGGYYGGYYPRYSYRSYYAPYPRYGNPYSYGGYYGYPSYGYYPHSYCW